MPTTSPQPRPQSPPRTGIPHTRHVPKCTTIHNQDSCYALARASPHGTKHPRYREIRPGGGERAWRERDISGTQRNAVVARESRNWSPRAREHSRLSLAHSLTPLTHSPDSLRHSHPTAHSHPTTPCPPGASAPDRHEISTRSADAREPLAEVALLPLRLALLCLLALLLRGGEGRKEG